MLGSGDGMRWCWLLPATQTTRSELFTSAAYHYSSSAKWNPIECNSALREVVQTLCTTRRHLHWSNRNRALWADALSISRSCIDPDDAEGKPLQAKHTPKPPWSLDGKVEEVKIFETSGHLLHRFVR